MTSSPTSLWRQNRAVYILAETVLGSALFTAGLWQLRMDLSGMIVGQGLLLLTAAAGFWAALRWRCPDRRPLLAHFMVALVLSLLMGGGYFLSLGPLGWTSILDLSPFGSFGLGLFLFGTGFVFLGFRLLMTLLATWKVKRRRRLHWSIVHAHLLLLVLASAIWAGVLFVSAMRMGWGLPEASLAASVMQRLIISVFPALAVAMVIGVVWIAILFFPLAWFASRITRPLTQRLERLTRATASLREGDLTARVEVEGEDELAALQADFNAMAEKLHEAQSEIRDERDRVASLLQERRELLARISHELRTPVSVLKLHLEPLRAGEPLDSAGLEILRSEVDRLGTLIADLFTLARSELQGLELKLEAVDLAELGGRICSALRPLARRSGKIELLCELPEQLPPGRADAGRLEQVLINLIRNAIENTSPGGLVVLSIEEGEGELILRVKDTGRGISPADLPRIWEPFWSKHPEGGREGTGLGLSLARELATAMNARLEVTSREGEGSCFHLHLPAALIES